MASERSHLPIPTRKPKPMDPERWSLPALPDEIVLLIVDHLQDVSPKSVIGLASASSFFYSKARYVQHRDLTINLTECFEESTMAYLNYLSTNDLLPAVRTLRLQNRVHISQQGYQSPALLADLIQRMTGLSDIYWKAYFQPISEPLLVHLQQRPRVRLHLSIDNFGGSGTPASQLDIMTGSPNLHSVSIMVKYTTAQQCRAILWPLKGLLLSCPHLRKLSLVFAMFIDGREVYGPQVGYRSLGLSNGERLPLVEELELFYYPYGRQARLLPADGDGSEYGTFRYPEQGTEQGCWAEQFDWSRLRRLATCDASLAYRIAPKLTALEEVSLDTKYLCQFPTPDAEREMAHFLRNVASALRSITVPNLPLLDTAAILRHGSRLRKLMLFRAEYLGRDQAGGVGSVRDLARLREGLPHLEELAIDIVKDGHDWPYESLDIVARFPRLRSATLSFRIAGREGATTPYLTMASVPSIFRFMRARSTTEPPSLQRLYLHFHTDHTSDSGAQSLLTSFACELGRSDGGSRDEVVVTCTQN